MKSSSGTGLASYSILSEVELREFYGEVKSLTWRLVGNTLPRTWEVDILQMKVLGKRAFSGVL